MTLFEWFVLFHLLGDYIFQTEYMALNKALGKFFNRALFSHCLVYTACFVPIFWADHLNFWWLGYIFVTHLFFDRRWPVIWIRRNFGCCSETGIEKTFWLTIVVDQIAHLFVLASVVALRALR